MVSFSIWSQFVKFGSVWKSNFQEHPKYSKNLTWNMLVCPWFWYMFLGSVWCLKFVGLTLVPRGCTKGQNVQVRLLGDHPKGPKDQTLDKKLPKVVCDRGGHKNRKIESNQKNFDSSISVLRCFNSVSISFFGTSVWSLVQGSRNYGAPKNQSFIY